MKLWSHKTSSLRFLIKPDHPPKLLDTQVQTAIVIEVLPLVGTVIPRLLARGETETETNVTVTHVNGEMANEVPVGGSPVPVVVVVVATESGLWDITMDEIAVHMTATTERVSKLFISISLLVLVAAPSFSPFLYTCRSFPPWSTEIIGPNKASFLPTQPQTRIPICSPAKNNNYNNRALTSPYAPSCPFSPKRTAPTHSRHLRNSVLRPRQTLKTKLSLIP